MEKYRVELSNFELDMINQGLSLLTSTIESGKNETVNRKIKDKSEQIKFATEVKEVSKKMMGLYNLS